MPKISLDPKNVKLPPIILFKPTVPNLKAVLKANFEIVRAPSREQCRGWHSDLAGANCVSCLKPLGFRRPAVAFVLNDIAFTVGGFCVACAGAFDDAELIRRQTAVLQDELAAAEARWAEVKQAHDELVEMGLLARTRDGSTVIIEYATPRRHRIHGLAEAEELK